MESSAGGRPPSRVPALLGRALPERGPLRHLAASVLAVTVGGGLLLGTTVLFLTRVRGMSAVEVGLGLTVGTLAGMVFGPVIGHAADRWSPRGVHVGTLLVGAAATVGFVLVYALWALVLVAFLTAAVGAAGQASRAPLIRALAGADYTSYLAYQRAVANVGVMLGAAVATVGIQLDTGPAYVTLILLSAATFVAGGLVLLRLPYIPPTAAGATHHRWAALTDRPYLAVTLINGGMSLHLAIPTFALPLWIADSTSAPRWAITALTIVNGVMVVAFQVRVSRGVVDPRSAGRRMGWSGVALLLALALVGLMAEVTWWAALLLLLVATVVYTLGELWHAAASFELAFGLAQPRLQGQYAGIFGLGQSLANAAAPTVLATLCLDLGMPGWLLLGVLLLAFGLVTPPVVGWAVRRRPGAETRTAVARRHRPKLSDEPSPEQAAPPSRADAHQKADDC